MDDTGSSGDFIPFRAVVLDGDTCTLVRLPADTSKRARWRRHPFGGDEALEPIVGEDLASIGPTQAMSILRRRSGVVVRQACLAQVPFDTGTRTSAKCCAASPASTPATSARRRR